MRRTSNALTMASRRSLLRVRGRRNARSRWDCDGISLRARQAAIQARIFCSPAGENRTIRVRASRTAHSRAMTRSKMAPPSAPPRWLRRSLQSRQGRQSGRRPRSSASTSMPPSEKKRRPSFVRCSPSWRRDEQSTLDEPVKHLHRQVACKVVIAGPRPAQFWIARAGAHAQVAGPRSHRHQGFERICDVSLSETEIPVPPLAFDHDEAGLFELGEMAARGREHQARFLRQLGRRERRTGKEGHQHVGTRRIADQRGDDRDVGAFLHSLMISELCRYVNMEECRRGSGIGRNEAP